MSKELSERIRDKFRFIPLLRSFLNSRYQPHHFKIDDELFRGYQQKDLTPYTYKIEAYAIRFPDFSTFWSRFAKPIAVRRRLRGRPTDGCYSITVEVARFNGVATPCHAPDGSYAHVEVRQLKSDEGVYFHVPHERELKAKDGWDKNMRREYRNHINLNKKNVFCALE